MRRSAFFTACLLVPALFVAACGETPSADGYSSTVHRMTAGAATISSIAKVCGNSGVDAYRTSFIHKMQAEQGVTTEGVTKINTLFERADEMSLARLADAAVRKEQCAINAAGRAANIKSGIAGDFTGQI